MRREKSTILAEELNKRAKVNALCSSELLLQSNSQKEIYDAESELVRNSEKAIKNLRRLVSFQDSPERIAGISWTSPDYRQRANLSLVNINEAGDDVINSVTMILNTTFAKTYVMPDGNNLFSAAK